MELDIKKDIIVLRELLNISQTELAQLLNVSYETINRWENGTTKPKIEAMERIYEIAFNNGIYFNKLYSQILKEEWESDNNVILFHGTSNKINLPIDLNHSRNNNDFGQGFYLGETFEQAATYVANHKTAYVYTFKLTINGLNIIHFTVEQQWMLMIAYVRGWLQRYQSDPLIETLRSKISSADLIIAPIADNRMFDLISEFGRGEITDQQCQHALAATNLGAQYIIKSETALKALSLLKVSYVSSPEKERYKKIRLSLHELNMDKVKLARIEYRGKGKYIDEVLK